MICSLELTLLASFFMSVGGHLKFTSARVILTKTVWNFIITRNYVARRTSTHCYVLP